MFTDSVKSEGVQSIGRVGAAGRRIRRVSVGFSFP